MRKMISVRAGLVAALLALGSVLIIPTASAHPTNVSVFCQGGTASYLCGVRYAGAHDPTTIRWYSNGTHISGFDDRTFLLQSCTLDTPYNVRAVVTDIHGSAEASSGWFRCQLL